MANSLTGKVLITGGAGFLGRGILRRAFRDNWDASITVLSRDEEKHRTTRQRYPDANYVVGDITDIERFPMIARNHDVVIHTAAIKYIPECEKFPLEAIRVNLDGTRNVMHACSDAKAVFISTDKAAHPLNVYGMTKALIEKLVRESSDWGEDYVACRYGNVVGSTGSVWHLAKQQIADSGHMKITDPGMTRFFMSVDEAIDLILASVDACPGSVVAPKPRGAKMYEIAAALSEHFDADSPPEVIGPRPGEKKHESMISPNEHMAVFGQTPYYTIEEWSDSLDRQQCCKGSTSDNPVSWLTGQEFVEMAVDAESV